VEGGGAAQQAPAQAQPVPQVEIINGPGR
jgi:hypothetical protein